MIWLTFGHVVFGNHHSLTHIHSKLNYNIINMDIDSNFQTPNRFPQHSQFNVIYAHSERNAFSHSHSRAIYVLV